jgi:NAD(P)-dependent dehydrogenase (short-subunit alcohol dehydrogenase family)
MDLGLAGKSALITGAAKGIGAATARVLAAEGCNLVLVDIDAAGLHSTQEDIVRVTPTQVKTSTTDLSQGENIVRLAGEFPNVDILVNNAGAIPAGNLQEIGETSWRAAWELKVFGYINMCRAYYPLMKQRGRGVIINVVGTAAQSRDPSYICGVTGNAALCAFSQSLGSESHKDGIRVIAVSPGPTATDRLVTLLRKRAQDRLGNPETWQQLVESFPFRRAAEPREIAAAVAFNASDHSSYTSGSIVTIDGGRSSRSN